MKAERPAPSVTRGVRVRWENSRFVYSAAGVLPSVDLADDARFAELLAARRSRGALFVAGAVASVLLGVAVGGALDSFLAFVQVLALAFPILAALRFSDSHLRVFSLQYDLPPRASMEWEEVLAAARDMGRSGFVRHAKSAQYHGDWKYSAGATLSVDLGPASVGFGSMPNVDCNVMAASFTGGATAVYLFPDRMIVVSNGRWRVASAGKWGIDLSRSLFRWHDPIPFGTEVVEWTWQYVNKDGGPDLRFASNPQVAVLDIAHVLLGIPEGPGVEILTGATDAAERLHEHLRRYLHMINEDARGRGRYSDEVEAALLVLGLADIPTAAQLRALHRAQAKAYHPDRVVQTDGHAVAAADERLKQVNHANDVLSSRARVSGPDADLLKVPEPISPEPEAVRARAWQRELLLNRVAPLVLATAIGGSGAVAIGSISVPDPTPVATAAAPPTPTATSVLPTESREVSDAGRGRRRHGRRPCLCGADGASPPPERLVGSWAEYRCALRDDVDDWSRCLARWEYAPDEGEGCPGAARCCPGIDDVGSLIEAALPSARSEVRLEDADPRESPFGPIELGPHP